MKTGRFHTRAAIATACDLSAAAFAQMRSGEIRPSRASLVALGRALLGDPISVTPRYERFLQLVDAFGYKEADVRARNMLRVAYWAYPNFADLRAGEWAGVAVTLVRHLAHFLGLTVDPVDHPRTLESAFEYLQDDKADIVASALCVTARRRRFMKFSDPLPGLALDVNAIVTSDSLEHPLGRAAKLTLDDLFVSPWVGGFSPVLVRHEAGHEYAQTFLPDMARRAVMLPDLGDRSAIAGAFATNHPAIGLFDSATCRQLCADTKDSLKLVRIPGAVVGTPAGNAAHGLPTRGVRTADPDER